MPFQTDGSLVGRTGVTPVKMHLALIINSVVCALGVPAGAFFAVASIVSIANMKVPWVGLLVVAAFLVPVVFAVSGIGAWVAFHWDYRRVTIGLMALPWVYSTVFVLGMLVSFKPGPP